MITYADIKRIKGSKALREFIDRNFNGDTGLFLEQFNHSISQMLHIDLKEAALLVESAPRIFGWLPKQYAPRLLAIQARYENWIGNLKPALRKYKQAIEGMLALRDFESAARMRLGIMDVQMYLGKYTDALDSGRKALAYFRRKKQMTLAARVMTNIGNVYHRLDNNRMALKYYDNAREIFSKAGGIPLAIVDYNRANILTNMGELEEAEKLYRQTAEIYEQNGIAINAVKANYSLAYLYFLGDKYTSALAGFERAYESFRELGDDKSAQAALLDMAEMHIYLHQYGSSIALAEEIIPRYQKYSQDYEEGKAACFAAEGLRNLGDYRDAALYLKKAARLFAHENNKLWIGMVHYLHSRLYIDNGKYRNALKSASLARRCFAGSGAKRRMTDADIALIEAGLKVGDGMNAPGRALKLLNRPLVSYQVYDLNRLLGTHYLESGKPAVALRYLKRAIKVAEQMLLNLYPDEIRFFFALGKQEVYLKAVESLLMMGKIRESFIENSRALAILNQKQAIAKSKTESIPKKYITTRNRLRASLKKLNRMPEKGHRLLEAVPDLHKTEEALWRNEKKIRARAYSSPVETAHLDINYGAISDNMGNTDSLINFIITSGKVGAYKIDSKQTHYYPLPVTAESLHTTIREFHFLMEKSIYSALGYDRLSEVTKDYLKRMHSWLIEPLHLDRKAGRLIMLLDGVFGQIPYAALMDDAGCWLNNKFDLAIITNPLDLMQPQTKPALKQNLRSAIFAPENLNLPLVASEARAISGFFAEARTYDGGPAKCSALLNELEKAKGFVHIAAHAARSSENPLFSRILMSDGPFFPFDLFGANVNASLVTLSGCQTAAPGIYYGNSFSLAKAFYQAGAARVLASLWPISDKVSLVFMQEFYKNLKKSGNVHPAYKTALAFTRNINENPAFWSPFVLLGM